MPRFVVLRHEFPADHRRASHWDLMFETDGVLRTWAIRLSPDESEPQPADALSDHRLEYLSYEGPVSGDRGSVTRWDSGTYHRLAESLTSRRDMGSGEFRFRVAGSRLCGAVELARGPEGWRYRFLTGDGSSSD